MENGRKNHAKKNPQVALAAKPTCLKIAESGIRTSKDFAMMMSGMMSDVVTGRIAPNVVRAACSAGSLLLRVSKLQLDYQNSNAPAKDKKAVLLMGE